MEFIVISKMACESDKRRSTSVGNLCESTAIMTPGAK
jgi:hypothetical protein